MTNLSKLKLKELVLLAQNINYIKPEKPYEKWNEDEILYHATYIGVTNQAQIDSLYLTCKSFPPMKVIAKERLRKFVGNFIN